MWEDLRNLEQRRLLSDREAGRFELTPDGLIRVFGSHVPTPRATDSTLANFRGDHALNPDMLPDRPLVAAAVLVPIVVREDGLTVLFTRRTAHLLNHAGQISFPGGHLEPEDANAEDAALRETEEEIGLGRDRIHIFGRLDDYITRTGFRVTPVVGLVHPPFELTPDPFEVDEVFEVPLAFLLAPGSHQRHTRIIKGVPRAYHAFPYRGYYIWGATAGMLVNLCEILRDG